VGTSWAETAAGADRRAARASARARGPGLQGNEDGAGLGQRRRGTITVAVGGVQLGERQEGEGALVWRGACIGQRKRRSEVGPRVGVLPRRGVQFAEQAVRGEEGERLARLRRVGKGLVRALPEIVPIGRTV
jgi:hypothetical protein